MAENTTTLADTLLNDLDDLSDNDDNNTNNDNESSSIKDETTENSEDNNNSKEVTTEKHTTTTIGINLYAPSSDEFLQRHMSNIRTLPDSNDLIMPTNRCLLKLREAYEDAYQELMTTYEPKFPELADLLSRSSSENNNIDPMLLYQRAVRTIGGIELDMTNVSSALETILSANQIITISVAGSTTSGRSLTQEEIQRMEYIDSAMTSIHEYRLELRSFVENRMKKWAPNTSSILGEALAAQLLDVGGGLQNLSKIPSCNLQVLSSGQKKGSKEAKEALLYQAELVQSCPSKFRRKAVKVVAAKVALAIRCDLSSSKSSSAGEGFRRIIEVKFQQWLTPSKAPVLKALPKPDLNVKKRRGGKRMRRLKERFEETELMKQANTRAFSTRQGEYGDDAMGLTLGVLDSDERGGGGRIRKNGGIEIKRMRYANTKASRKREQQQAQMAARHSSSTSSSGGGGLASSMVFTPVQGMELIDPTLRQKRVQDANRKWFANDAGFQSAIPKNM